MKKILAFLMLLVSLNANAGAIFIGSFNVYDGPYWEDNPIVYSAREAAALIFGGTYTDYAISIDASLDPASITHSAYYSGWGSYDYHVFDEDFKLDLGGSGYNSYQGGDQFLSAFSAYVSEGLYVDNYVWKVINDTIPVGEPGTLLIMGLGLLIAATCIRRKRSNTGPKA